MVVPTDEEIERLRVIGEIRLALKSGNSAERESLLRAIRAISTQRGREWEAWVKMGCPETYSKD
jgi:hypothetical protein